MNISGRCDYACRALIELAVRYEAGVPVTAQVIAEQRQVPEKYLTHILLQLKRARLVRSVRGAQGGYALVDLPEKTTLLDIIEAIDGPITGPKRTEDATSSDLYALWQAVVKDISGVLQRMTLREMMDMTTKTNMFHI